MVDIAVLSSTSESTCIPAADIFLELNPYLTGDAGLISTIPDDITACANQCAKIVRERNQWCCLLLHLPPFDNGGLESRTISCQIHASGQTCFTNSWLCIDLSSCLGSPHHIWVQRYYPCYQVQLTRDDAYHRPKSCPTNHASTRRRHVLAK